MDRGGDGGSVTAPRRLRLGASLLVDAGARLYFRSVSPERRTRLGRITGEPFDSSLPFPVDWTHALTALAMCWVVALAASPTLAQPHEVTIQVIPPAGYTPEDATLYLSGSGAAFGDWRPDGVAMRRVNDALWTHRHTTEAGTQLRFKVTRGTWNRQAIYQPGTPASDTVVEVTGDTTVTLRPLDWNDTALQSATGTIRYHHNVASPRTRHARDLIVWLPPGYDSEPERRYSVLYIHDGQNVFDRTTSYGGHEWRMDEIADSLI
ncbi:MAG: carbohydrate-binding module family 20 domain-containing protein, partial [Bacteroidota bacterium]